MLARRPADGSFQHSLRQTPLQCLASPLPPPPPPLPPPPPPPPPEWGWVTGVWLRSNPKPPAKDHITPAGPPPRFASERRRGQMFKRVGRGRGSPDLCSRLLTSNAGSHGRERRANLCSGVASSVVYFFFSVWQELLCRVGFLFVRPSICSPAKSYRISEFLLPISLEKSNFRQMTLIVPLPLSPPTPPFSRASEPASIQKTLNWHAWMKSRH